MSAILFGNIQAIKTLEPSTHIGKLLFARISNQYLVSSYKAVVDCTFGDCCNVHYIVAFLYIYTLNPQFIQFNAKICKRKESLQLKVHQDQLQVCSVAHQTGLSRHSDRTFDWPHPG